MNLISKKLLLSLSLVSGFSSRAEVDLNSNLNGLQKGGCAWRRAMMDIIKVYEICMLSASKDPQKWREAFSDSGNFRFALHLDFHFNVGGKRAANAFREALQEYKTKNESDNKQRNDFLQWIEEGTVKKGTQVYLVFDQRNNKVAAKIISQNEDKIISYDITNPDTAFSLANIYLGDKPFRENIKQALLSPIDMTTAKLR